MEEIAGKFYSLEEYLALEAQSNEIMKLKNLFHVKHQGVFTLY
jgi:hypothetical protein